MKNNLFLKLTQYLIDIPLNNHELKRNLNKILNTLIRITNSKTGILFLSFKKESGFDFEPLITFPHSLKKEFKNNFDNSVLKNFLTNNTEKIEILKKEDIKSQFEESLIKNNSLLVIPLKNKLFDGILEIVEYPEEALTQNELVELKNTIEKYILNLLNSYESSEQIKEFSKLIEITNILNSTLNLDNLLNRIIGEAKEVMNTEGCSLMLIDKDTKELIFRTVRGKKRDIIKEFRIPPGKGIAGWIVQTGKSVIVNDVSKDSRFYSQTDLKSGFKTRNLLGAPLKTHNEIIGVIEAVNKKKNKNFNELDEKFFVALANQAAIAIQNAQYYTELKNLFINTIRSIVNAIDAKDPYTKGHSERVTKYSLLLAKNLKLNSKELEQIQLAALLHDVGKIGIDEKILQKPGKLTDEEYMEIKKHPVIGENILKPIESLKEILPYIRHHHERWDGRGYPDKLKNEEIPLPARIIALADTYDAITSDRPYRKGKSKNYALTEIKRCSGFQFDPNLVNVFIKTIKNFKETGIKVGGFTL